MYPREQLVAQRVSLALDVEPYRPAEGCPLENPHLGTGAQPEVVQIHERVATRSDTRFTRTTVPGLASHSSSGGETILLAALSNGTVVAFGNTCPHLVNPLDGGTLWDDEIDCPYHHYTYDARAGRNRFPVRVFPAARARTLKGIPVFDVREEEGWIWVGPRRPQP